MSLKLYPNLRKNYIFALNKCTPFFHHYFRSFPLFKYLPKCSLYSFRLTQFHRFTSAIFYGNFSYFTTITTISSLPLHYNKQLSVLFFGSDDFSIESLRLLKSKLQSVKVSSIYNDTITDPSTLQYHNNNPVKTELKHLEVVTTSKLNQVYNYCSKMNIPCHLFENFCPPSGLFDLGVVSSFGRLIPNTSIKACRHGKRQFYLKI